MAGLKAKAVIAITALVLLPGQAGPAHSTEDLSISRTDNGLQLEASAVPLDEILRALGEMIGFSVAARCAADGCPTFSGHQEGRPSQLLAWLLKGQNHAILFGESTGPGGQAQIEKVILKTRAIAPVYRAPRAAAIWETGPIRSPFAGPVDAALRARVLGALALDLEVLSSAGGPYVAERVGVLSESQSLEPVLRALPLVAPLKRYRVTSGFGARRDPLNGRNARHEGLDLAAVPGAPVLSTAPGVVREVGWQGDYGRLVEVDHGFGFRTRYAHLSKATVEPGETVESGEALGVIGRSGRTTGPHLHYEVLVEGVAVDPMKFLKAGRLN